MEKFLSGEKVGEPFTGETVDVVDRVPEQDSKHQHQGKGLDEHLPNARERERER